MADLFASAQPALLYLVPCTLVPLLGKAVLQVGTHSQALMHAQFMHESLGMRLHKWSHSQTSSDVYFTSNITCGIPKVLGLVQVWD